MVEFIERPLFVAMRNEHATLIRLRTDRLDARNSGPFLADLREVSKGSAVILLDVETVVYLNSAGLPVLLTFNSEAKHRGASMILMNLRPSLLDVLELMKYTRFFDIRDAAGSAATIAEHFGDLT